ncbi:MAG TPA: hypothetical protein VGU25_12455 [Acidobacteriaceae bacterium]|nr:hypothetical protein [Acidobacteriaceae bacterium]
MCSSGRKASAVPFHLLIFGALLLTGCSGSFAPGPVTLNKTPIGTIQGKVHGGNFPVSGAQIYLFAAGQGGYGTSATSLLTSGASGVSCSNGAVAGACYVLTDSNGNFAVGGDYTCTEGQQVYMVAVGGNPGLSGTVNNTAIVQMAALGQCPASGSMAAQVPYLVINEVTTVAFAYSVGGFATTAYNVSSDVAGETALANAFANANNIVNLWYGQAATTTNWYGGGLASPNGNRNGVNPQSKIYALANILATCVNTSSASSSQCMSLFQAATTTYGTQATDEANAIFNIVHNQANTSTNPTRVANIWNLTPTTPVFTPTLTTQPADWTMPVIYNSLLSQPATDGNNKIISGPFNIAFDSNGNAWIGDRVKGVVKVGPLGAANTYNYSFGMVKGVAVSPADGTIWVSDYGNSIVDVLDTSGNITQTVTASIKNNGPILTSFALDPDGSGYLAYQANEDTPGIVLFDASSSTYTKVKYEKGSTGFPDINTPGWIAVDNTGQSWLPSTGTAYTANLTVTLKNGTRTYKADESAGPQSYTTASDSNSNVWITTNTGTAYLDEITNGSTTVTASYNGGGMNEPYKLVVDGANTIWIANAGANTVSAYSPTTSNWLASSGFSTGAVSGTGAIVIGVDGSGNVWTGNADGSVTQLLGLATPTAMPFYGGATVITGTGNSQTTTIIPGNLGTKP